MLWILIALNIARWTVLLDAFWHDKYLSSSLLHLQLHVAPINFNGTEFWTIDSNFIYLFI
jgi:hypothetical protein